MLYVYMLKLIRFLVFAVEVLAKNGYLKLGDDIMHELMGC